MPREILDEVRVEVGGRKGQAPFVYVNEGYTGSTTNVAAVNRTDVSAPVNGVYREQYCVCARWPYTQRVLAVAVGILLGALIGLSISIAFRDKKNPIGPIF